MRSTPSARRPPAPPRKAELAMRVSVSRLSRGSPSDGLTGDDETSAKGFERRVPGGVRTLRHVEAFLVRGYLWPRCWEQLISLSANRAIVDEVKEEKRLKRISRRGFIFGSAAFSAVGRGGFGLRQGSGAGRLVLVGTQTSGSSKGVYSYSFDPDSGELRGLGLAAEADNPTFLALAPNGRTVLVANELDTV